MESCATSILSKIILGSLTVITVSLAIFSLVAAAAFVVSVAKGKFWE
jgi:hypothetical protein